MKVTFSEHTYYDEKISSNPVLIDLGSCKGAFTNHFYEKFPTATIILVEPSKSNFPLINIEGEKIQKIFGAVSSEHGQIVTFYEDLKSEQNGSLLFNYFNGLPYDVETVSLDELIKPFDTVDLVKMDIEGAEWDSIMKMKDETLAKIQQLTVEFHDFLDPSLAIKSEEAVQKLLSSGFKVEYNPTTYMYGSKYYDSLFYR